MRILKQYTVYIMEDGSMQVKETDMESQQIGCNIEYGKVEKWMKYIGYLVVRTAEIIKYNNVDLKTALSQATNQAAIKFQCTVPTVYGAYKRGLEVDAETFRKMLKEVLGRPDIKTEDTKLMAAIRKRGDNSLRKTAEANYQYVAACVEKARDIMRK